MQRVHVDDLTGFLLAEDQEILAQYLQQPQGRELASSGKSGPPAVNSDPEQRATMMRPSDSRTLEALLRSDFRAFVHKVFATLSPGQTYVSTWHVAAIAWRLEQVHRGEIRRLIINMPPRSLKSITASVAFPAYVLGHDPSRRFICVSYSGDLSRKHSNDFRAVIESPWYRRTFPNVRIGPYKNSETEIELAARGFRLATSVGGDADGTRRRHHHHRRSAETRRRDVGNKTIGGESVVREHAALAPRRQAHRRDRGRHAARSYG